MPQTAPSRRLTLKIDRKASPPVVRCEGRLVAGVADLLYSEVKALIPGSKQIVLDFTELTHMDSTGIGNLVRLYVHTKSAGCALEIINMGPSIRQLLGITHVLSVFETITTHNIRMG